MTIWTKEENDTLADMVADGKSLYAVAKQLGRSVDSVKSRWRKIVRAMGAQAI